MNCNVVGLPIAVQGIDISVVGLSAQPTYMSELVKVPWSTHEEPS